MTTQNPKHPANFEEPLKITVEPIEQGDACGYLVYAAGHGSIQKQYAADKGEVKALVATILDQWADHCKEKIETGTLGRRIQIDGPIDLPAAP